MLRNCIKSKNKSKNLYLIEKTTSYPDLPNGYQISQFEVPVVGLGELVIDFPDGRQKNWSYKELI